MELQQSQHYFNLTVKRVIRETYNAISIVFAQPSPKINYKPGQFLNLIATIDGQEVRRAYSLCSSPLVDDDLIVAVKRVRNGIMSNYLADNIKAGDQLKVTEPLGHFSTEIRKENKQHLVMFSRGSGITPILSILKSVLAGEPDSICSLIYYNWNVENIIFKDELTRLQTRYSGRLHLIQVLENAPDGWEGYTGSLDSMMLEKLLSQLPDWGFSRTTYFMCGPENMMKNVESFLTEQGIPAEKILREKFIQGSSNKDTPSKPLLKNVVRLVTIRYDGKEHNVTVHPSNTILQAALEQDIDIPYSCQNGYCTACMGKTLSGKIMMDDEEGLSHSERAQGYVLTCVGRSLSDDVVIEISSQV